MPRILFTRDNAREMAARSNAVQRQRRHERQLVASPPCTAVQGDDEYVLKRLARVRAQLDRIDRMIQSETDPAKLDRLAAASMRLSDQECAVADRPKPCNRKPSPRRAAQVLPAEPLDPPLPGDGAASCTVGVS